MFSGKLETVVMNDSCSSITLPVVSLEGTHSDPDPGGLMEGTSGEDP